MRSLYLGLDAHSPLAHGAYHYPVIRIEALPLTDPLLKQGLEQLSLYTHLLFTSQVAVRLFLQACTQIGMRGALQHQAILSIGQRTTALLEKEKFTVFATAKEETSEGVAALLAPLLTNETYLFWPHSAKSRPVIADFLRNRQIPFYHCALYDTLFQEPEPPLDLSEFDEIIFTSPTTVEGFLKIYRSFPPSCLLKAIGPVTDAFLQAKIKERA